MKTETGMPESLFFWTCFPEKPAGIDEKNDPQKKKQVLLLRCPTPWAYVAMTCHKKA
ncbi:hypothetical protein TPL01_11580 [Sulfuriferula plumbiphila]|uniref:Uncharacterized protein n=1 Tax=Sulfuriferula plumbiphila TaxID=171865 RepID=A0A512L6B4_9PROT|nr:hypothetical protein SFPGR_10410 [Sulfuriferula plumbiphila]GEP30020.1 hypothetical protein TPL01_11580 [Sulfuriferula plumbiphila]